MSVANPSSAPERRRSVGSAGTVADVPLLPLSPRVRWTRLLQTARYFRAGQILRRMAAILGRRLHANKSVERYGSHSAGIVLSQTPELREIADRKLEQRRNDPDWPERVAAIAGGSWTFLGRTQALGLPIDWKSPLIGETPRLWQFHLQYHEWLLDLAAADASPETAEEVWRHVTDWLRTYTNCNEREAGDAWHPYCISRRLPAWLSLWSWHEPPECEREKIVRSMAAQAAYLERRLETDLGGNHLLENARALVLAGAAFRNSAGDAWLDHGLQILEHELREQILSQGEHFERSPMYHCQMTEALEDVRDATRGLRPEHSVHCAALVERMHEFTAAIVHPDGDIPLLGDSVFDEAALPLVDQRDRTRTDRGARQVGDYWTYRDGGDYLLFDAGPVGPDHLPAHAHADLLNIEASFGGMRFLVDSGTYDYEDGEMRQYCRSTAAHNVLEIDGENQCDVYSRFRMGRRGWPTQLIAGQSDDGWWAQASHNAYRHRGVPVVGRWILCRDDGWVIVDGAEGEGAHALVSRLHLHPDVLLTRLSDSSVKVERAGVVRCLSMIGRGELFVTSGWYCPRFGERLANRVVEAQFAGRLPAAVGWHITFGESSAAALAAASNAALRFAKLGSTTPGGWRMHLQPAAG